MARLSEIAGVVLTLVSVLAVVPPASTAEATSTPPPPIAAGKVTGSLAYRERIALPPTATIRVQLVDVSRADAPAVVLGEQIIEAGGRQVPFAFEIPYQPGRIEANHTYAVQARIEDGGRLLFINDQRHAVITRGAPTAVQMMLRSVGGQADR